MNDDEGFSPGIQMLLGRIENFPHEFSTGGLRQTKWYELAAVVMREKDTFSDAERKAVRDALRNNRHREFDGKVLELLAAQNEPRKQIQITRAQAETAHKLGLSLEDYVDAVNQLEKELIKKEPR